MADRLPYSIRETRRRPAVYDDPERYTAAYRGMMEGIPRQAVAQTLGIPGDLMDLVGIGSLLEKAGIPNQPATSEWIMKQMGGNMEDPSEQAAGDVVMATALPSLLKAAPKAAKWGYEKSQKVPGALRRLLERSEQEFGAMPGLADGGSISDLIRARREAADESMMALEEPPTRMRARIPEPMTAAPRVRPMSLREQLIRLMQRGR